MKHHPINNHQELSPEMLDNVNGGRRSADIRNGLRITPVVVSNYPTGRRNMRTGR